MVDLKVGASVGMKHKLLPFLIGIFVCSYLFGHQQVFAENSVNNSVFEFYEQQDSQEKMIKSLMNKRRK